MDKKTKKIVLVTTSLLLIGGAIYWLWRRKKSGEPTMEIPSGTPIGTPIETPTTDKPSNVLAFQKFANSKGYSPKLVEDGVWGAKTSAAWSVLGKQYNLSEPINASSFTDPSKMVGKNVYALSNVTGIYNFSLTKIGTAKKDEYLGKVTKVERTSAGSYMLTVASPLKTAYKVSSESVYFK